MRKLPHVVTASLLGGVLALSAVASAAGQDVASMPKVGDVAPDFKLSYVDGKEMKDVTLSQYRGKKNVVVAFFVFAFTGG